MSPAQILMALPEAEREEALSKLTPQMRAALKYNWEFWARPNQLEPKGDWTSWLILAGRGFGKTRCGAEWVRQKAFDFPGCRIALVAETAADARKVMVEGESGILNISPPSFKPEYSPANRQLTWPNGSIAFTYNATQPDQLRGPQHHFAWSDEIAKWDYLQESWDQLQFGLRLGVDPRQVITTTPRPLPLIRKMLVDETVHVTRGRTYDNASNLAAPFLKQVEESYGGSRLGRQELEGEVLEDIPGALWSRDSIDKSRRPEAPKDLIRIVVAVDPAVTSNEGSDETGIVVVAYAKDPEGAQHGYILHDGSLKGQPQEWAKRAVDLFHKYDADKIVAESNQGGDMVETVIKAVDRNVPVTLVRATRGKRVRAEPVATLYEQGRIHHVGRFDKLEDQMCLFSSETGRSVGESPDRVDALVWGVTAVFDKLTARRGPKEDSSDIDYKNPYHLSGGQALWMAG